MTLSAQRWRQKSHAAVLLAMQTSTTLSKARDDGCVDPGHCRAASAPSPLSSVARHDTHSGKEVHCCLKKVQSGMIVFSHSLPLLKALSSVERVAVKVVHAGERNAAAFVLLLVAASWAVVAACSAAKHCRQFVSAKHAYSAIRQLSKAIPYVSVHRSTPSSSCRAG